MVLLNRFETNKMFHITAKLVHDASRTLVDDLISNAYERVIYHDPERVPPLVDNDMSPIVPVVHHPETMCEMLRMERGAPNYNWKTLALPPQAALLLAIQHGEMAKLRAMDTLYLRSYDEQHVPTFECTIRIGAIRCSLTSLDKSQMYHAADDEHSSNDLVIIPLLSEDFEPLLEDRQRFFYYSKYADPDTVEPQGI